MTVKDIASVIEAWAPLGIQEEWDNSGLIIGNPEDEVHGVLVAFDCTAALVREAVKKGCDMIVTHHPLIFRGVRRIRSGECVGDAIIEAVRSGVAIYAAHTNADKVPEGVSGAMARRLGLKDVNVLCDEGGYGLGAVGTLEKPMSGEEALDYVASRFSLETIRYSAPVPEIQKVAVLGGSGASEIEAARRSGAQLFISADISYHHFFTDGGLMLMDIGHFESEVEIVDILFSLIRKNFPTFAVLKTEELVRSNPVHYYVK